MVPIWAFRVDGDCSVMGLDLRLGNGEAEAAPRRVGRAVEAVEDPVELSGGMPLPVSSTVTSSLSPVSFADSSTRPSRGWEQGLANLKRMMEAGGL